MLESGNVALWKWFVPRSERCRGSHEVKERGSSREKKWHKELPICENIE